MVIFQRCNVIAQSIALSHIFFNKPASGRFVAQKVRPPNRLGQETGKQLS
jgi:hypothetical protein